VRGLLLELLFPGRCLLCGEWLSFAGGRGLPVCGSCQGGLAPLGGPRCRVCSTPLISEHGICTRCRETSFAFASNLSVYAYAGQAKQLITLYKFSGRTRLAALFGEVLAKALHEEFPGTPVVPVPPRPGRAGRDPVRRIARILEKHHKREVLGVLSRTGGATQKSLDFERRRSNLQGRIRMLPGRTVIRPVVLLDDVFTTGATADACARVLREAGCPEVRVLSLAVDT
jgi:ComF family protein